jgi:hypothetical protein
MLPLSYNRWQPLVTNANLDETLRSTEHGSASTWSCQRHHAQARHTGLHRRPQCDVWCVCACVRVEVDRAHLRNKSKGKAGKTREKKQFQCSYNGRPASFTSVHVWACLRPRTHPPPALPDGGLCCAAAGLQCRVQCRHPRCLRAGHVHVAESTGAPR